jgi:photosystem II stability/assembly factor-like uncharacterized protein
VTDPIIPKEWTVRALFEIDGVLYVATEDTIRRFWKSVDKGETWARIESDEWSRAIEKEAS